MGNFFHISVFLVILLIRKSFSVYYEKLELYGPYYATDGRFSYYNDNEVDQQHFRMSVSELAFRIGAAGYGHVLLQIVED